MVKEDTLAENATKRRVIAYVDGLNLYHGIRDMANNTSCENQRSLLSHALKGMATRPSQVNLANYESSALQRAWSGSHVVYGVVEKRTRM